MEKRDNQLAMKGKARNLFDAIRQMRGIERRSGPTDGYKTYINKEKVLAKFEQYEFPEHKVITLFAIAMDIEGETVYWKRSGSDYWSAFGPDTYLSNNEPLHARQLIEEMLKVECYIKEITIKT